MNMPYVALNHDLHTTFGSISQAKKQQPSILSYPITHQIIHVRHEGILNMCYTHIRKELLKSRLKRIKAICNKQHEEVNNV
jgi:hypothetical protein